MSNNEIYKILEEEFFSFGFGRKLGLHFLELNSLDNT